MTEPVPSLPPVASHGRKRRVAAVVGTIGVVAVIGAGGWAWQGWLAQGPQASEALPGDTLAYVGIDLDPPGGQKVEAYRTLKRFPTFVKQLGLKGQDDLRRSVLDKVSTEAGCDLGYDDLADWAGERAALAVVPQDEPELVAVVQVSDDAKARAGLDEAVASCGEDVGYALGDGWAVLARNDEVARRAVADGRRTRLGEDADFQELTSAAGDAGVLTLYAAPEAGQALLDAVEEDPFLSFFLATPPGSTDPIDMLMAFSTFGGDVEGFDEGGVGVGVGVEMPAPTPEEQELWDRLEKMDQLSPAEQDQLMEEMGDFYANQVAEELPDVSEEELMEGFAVPVSDETRRRLEDFTGLGGVARFDDGALELEVVGDPILTGSSARYDGTDALAAISRLPENAALAFGGGFADHWAERTITGGPLSFGQEPDQLLADFEKATGLTTDDLEDLGGDSIAFVAGPGFEEAFSFGDEPVDVPVAARITGDAAKVEAALEKLRASIPGKDVLPSVRSGDAVVVGADRAFIEKVAKATGTLGDADRFAKVVPDARDALTITYVDFDRGDWAARLSEGDLSSADLAPLDAAGMTVSDAGGRQRVVVRVTFDD